MSTLYGFFLHKYRRGDQEISHLYIWMSIIKNLFLFLMLLLIFIFLENNRVFCSKTAYYITVLNYNTEKIYFFISEYVYLTIDIMCIVYPSIPTYIHLQLTTSFISLYALIPYKEGDKISKSAYSMILYTML